MPALIACAPYQNNNPAASLQGMLDGSRNKICSGYKGYKFTTDARGDPNAMLWTPVTSAVSGTSIYGWVVCGQTAPAATVSTPVWAIVAWCAVEFAMAS